MSGSSISCVYPCVPILNCRRTVQRARKSTHSWLQGVYAEVHWPLELVFQIEGVSSVGVICVGLGWIGLDLPVFQNGEGEQRWMGMKLEMAHQLLRFERSHGTSWISRTATAWQGQRRYPFGHSHARPFTIFYGTRQCRHWHLGLGQHPLTVIILIISEVLHHAGCQGVRHNLLHEKRIQTRTRGVA